MAVFWETLSKPINALAILSQSDSRNARLQMSIMTNCTLQRSYSNHAVTKPWVYKYRLQEYLAQVFGRAKINSRNAFAKEMVDWPQGCFIQRIRRADAQNCWKMVDDGCSCSWVPCHPGIVVIPQLIAWTRPVGSQALHARWSLLVTFDMSISGTIMSRHLRRSCKDLLARSASSLRLWADVALSSAGNLAHRFHVAGCGQQSLAWNGAVSTESEHTSPLLIGHTTSLNLKVHSWNRSERV